MIDYTLFNEDIKDLLLFNEVILKPLHNENISKLPTMSYRTLCILMKLDGICINELSTILNITKQQTSVIIKRLEEDHYIYTKKHETDKRKICIFIEEKAKSMLDEQLNNYARVFHAILYKYPQEKQLRLMELVRELHMSVLENKEEA